MMHFQPLMEQIGMAIDAAGVAVIAIGILWATARLLFKLPPQGLTRYSAYRQNRRGGSDPAEYDRSRSDRGHPDLP